MVDFLAERAFCFNPIENPLFLLVLLGVPLTLLLLDSLDMDFLDSEQLETLDLFNYWLE